MVYFIYNIEKEEKMGQKFRTELYKKLKKYTIVLRKSYPELSKRQLAIRIGVSDSTINKWIKEAIQDGKLTE